jgi:hypothetical protein
MSVCYACQRPKDTVEFRGEQTCKDCIREIKRQERETHRGNNED